MEAELDGEIAVEAEDVEPACRHHWVLGSPENERVVGRCKRCDEIRVCPATGLDWEVPAERGDLNGFADDDRIREVAEQVMRWTA